MELSQEVIDRFVGGQLEVQNQREGYLCRGEIASVELTGEGEDRRFSVTFEWFAVMGNDTQWKVAKVVPYSASLLIYRVAEIDDGRLCLQCGITGEVAVLFPPDGSKLDPSNVRGLAPSI